jgi:hypothetical protein
MKSKKERSGSKENTTRKSEKELNFEESVKEFTTSQQLPEQFNKMFAEIAINTGKEDCSGNCITCKKQVGCETYRKIQDCFTGRG